MPDTIRLAVTIDDPERAAAYRRAAGRLRRVTVAERVDASDVMVTADPEAASGSLRSGRHVILEDAFRTGARALDDLSEASRAARRHVMPAHPWRFRPSTRAVRDALDAGKLGEPGLLRIHRWEPRPAAGAPVERPALTAEVDLANWFFAGRPREVYAVAREGYLQAHLGFAGGGMALVDAASLPSGDGYGSLSLIGSTGAAYADDHHDAQLLYAGGPPRAIGAARDDFDVLGLLDELVRAIREERAPSVTLEATRRAAEVVRAVTAAAAEGRVARSSGGAYEIG